MTAVGLLNGGVTECNDRIQLRDRLPQKQGSQRKSMRQSLTSSLSRIGNRMRRRKPQLQRLQSTLDFDDLAQNELELKANLYWHIGTPIKRWKVEGQVPVKLILQLLKTLCLIVQVSSLRGDLIVFINITFFQLASYDVCSGSSQQSTFSGSNTMGCVYPNKTLLLYVHSDPY